jgi:hypothetical protein
MSLEVGIGGRAPRPRRYIHPAALKLLSPLFRQSMTRDAYVLRLVGNRLGPVLRPSYKKRSD